MEQCFCIWELLRISVTHLVWWHELPGSPSFTGTMMEAPQRPLCPQSQPEHCHQSSADHPLFISGHFCASLLTRGFKFLNFALTALFVLVFVKKMSGFSSHPHPHEPIPATTLNHSEAPWAFQLRAFAPALPSVGMTFHSSSSDTAVLISFPQLCHPS